MYCRLLVIILFFVWFWCAYWANTCACSTCDTCYLDLLHIYHHLVKCKILDMLAATCSTADTFICNFICHYNSPPLIVNHVLFHHHFPVLFSSSSSSFSSSSSSFSCSFSSWIHFFFFRSIFYNFNYLDAGYLL